jgi:hypothetical protein
MISTLMMSLFSIFFDLLAILRISKSDKDLEILILRQQVRILQRKTKTRRVQKPHLSLKIGQISSGQPSPLLLW